MHDDDVKSFVFRADKAFNPAKLEDFLGAIVQVYGPKMLRYKGVLNTSTERFCRTVDGDHPSAAVANHASNSSLIVERDPTARTHRTRATMSASSRSASLLLPRMVIDRSIRRPVSGSTPT